MWDHLKVIDGHVHYAWPISEDSLASALAATGADAVCLAALPVGFTKGGCAHPSTTLDCLAFKLRFPETAFVFGCLDCTAYGEKKRLGSYFADYTKRLLEMGCDGIKMLEGKPTMRRSFPIPAFDDPVWEPYWTYAEEKQVPILMHVNDPEEFWNPDALPEVARLSGWGYGPDDINNEVQYTELFNLLKRHPNLNITFAHMFFFSGQLLRLSEWLDSFPHMRVDLTPGIELIENMSRDIAASRAFFLKYQDRIHFGTDIGGRTVGKGVTELNMRESMLRAKYEHDFICGSAAIGVRADDDYLIGRPPFVLRGLDLPDEVQQKILYGNFLDFVGCEKPWPVNVELCLKEIPRQRRMNRILADKLGCDPDYSALDWAKRILTDAKRSMEL